MNATRLEPTMIAVRNRSRLRHKSSELRKILIIEESIVYMAQHLNRPLRVATLAARADLCKSHFSALFKRYVGGTPIDYFIRLRLQQACQLLENTEMSVKSIAYTLGYDDPFYFSRLFKSFIRMSPTTYKLEARDRDEHQGIAGHQIVHPCLSNQNKKTGVPAARRGEETLKATVKVSG